MLGPCFVTQCFVSIHLDGESWLVYFNYLINLTVSVLWLMLDIAIGWSAVCGCGFPDRSHFFTLSGQKIL